MDEDAKRLVSQAQGLPECNDTPAHCLEMEITPGKEAYQNYFFDKADLNASGAKSALEGQTLCFYGPWVNDEVHGTHPEIHPSELLWWQEKDNANSGTFLPSWC